jgi:hypothetical protein
VLKFLIVVVMVLLVASLASGLYFLMVDQGDPGRRRLFMGLTPWALRLTLALALMGLIVFGVATGRLGHGNPWDAGPLGAAEARQ